MKQLSRLLAYAVFSAVATLIVTAQAQARASPQTNSHFAYSVFMKDSISSRSSDFQGLTGAGGRYFTLKFLCEDGIVGRWRGEVREWLRLW